jgi:hypothetical protein
MKDMVAVATRDPNLKIQKPLIARNHGTFQHYSSTTTSYTASSTSNSTHSRSVGYSEELDWAKSDINSAFSRLAIVGVSHCCFARILDDKSLDSRYQALHVA